MDGDVVSAGLGINDRGEVVGGSGPDIMHSRAVIWKHGKIADLNTLIPAHSPLTLLVALAINARGEIGGFGVTGTGEIHAFLAIPCDRNHAGDKCCRDRDSRVSGEDETPESPKAIVSESVLQSFQRHIGHGADSNGASERKLSNARGKSWFVRGRPKTANRGIPRLQNTEKEKI